MDLPTCPSCGQSVLDENPETCPFCGASMKSGKKPQKSAGPGPAKTAGVATGQKTGSKQEEEDPFAIDTSAHKAAVRVALRRSPERDYRVVCPMCETVGYVPKSAAGQPVKCANPSCMVPIFEAPEIEKKEEPQEAPRGKNSPVMIVAALGMTAIAGFSVWYFVIRDANPRKPPQDSGPPVAFQSDPDTLNTDTTPENGKQEPGPEPEPAFDFVSFRQELLDKTMQEIARTRQRNSQTNRPPDCRQILAETYARLNQLENAKAQLPHIDKLSPETYFNKRLSPLIAIAWRQQKPEDVKATVAQAERAAEGVPAAGRSRFDNLSALGALLVAQNRTEDARRWIEKSVREANITDPVRKDRLRQSSAHLRVLRDLPDYSFSPLIDHPAHRWEVPEWVTVTMLLAGHGQDQKVLEWVKISPRDRVRGDSLLAYSRWKIQRGEMTADQVEALVKSEPKVNQIRVLAEASRQFGENGDKESSAKLLAAASQDAGSIQPAEEFQLPSASEILKLQPTDPEPVMNQVLALSALANAQVAAGETEQGFQTVQTALKLCRTIGPSPTALASRPHKQNAPGADKIEQELKEKLKLTSDNELRKSFNEYTSKLDSFEPNSQLRFRAEEALLGEAVFWGLVSRVWEELQSRIDESNNDLKEPWLESELLPEVARALEEKNATDQLNELKRRTGNRLPQRNAQLSFMSELDGMIAQQNFSKMTQAIEDSGIDRERLETTLLDRLRTHANQGEFELMVQMIKSIPERLRGETDLSLVNEELYFFLGRIAARSGQAREIIPMVTDRSPSPTEEIALLSGVAIGLEDAGIGGKTTTADTSL